MEGIFLYAFILAIVLALSRWNNPSDVRSLSFIVIILILGVEVGYGWLYFSESIYNLPHLIRLNTPLVFLIGPAFFLNVKGTRLKGLAFQKLDFFHLIPSLLCILYFGGFYFKEAQEKLIYFNELRSSQGFDSYVIGGARRIQQGTYLLLIAHQLKLIKGLLRQEKINVIILSSGFFGIWLLDIYRYFVRFDWSTGILDMWVISAFLLLILFIELRYRSDTKSYSKYATSGLKLGNDEVAKNIISSLETHKKFLNPKFKLAELAKDVSMHPNHVSQAISTSLKSNFNDLINSYRTDEAKKLLSEISNNHFTLEAIGQMAGFNSSTTFNAAFKKFSGITPREFKISQQQRKLTK